jgi:hypothetical protein
VLATESQCKIRNMLRRGNPNRLLDDISNPRRTQTWTLDDLGNWDQTVLDGTTETRTHNDVNELTQRTGGVGNLDAILRVREIGVTRIGTGHTEEVVEAAKERFGG